ncbi:MAG: hypothetical protein EBQ85_05155 [Proteobacteria bacterium]|nr:hypothetical protein [Pseudomonadota bacterium]
MMVMGGLYTDMTMAGMPFANGGSTSSNGSNSYVNLVNIDGSAPNHFKNIANAPYSQFDFFDTWTQVDTNSYPTLKWLEAALGGL